MGKGKGRDVICLHSESSYRDVMRNPLMMGSGLEHPAGSPACLYGPASSHVFIYDNPYSSDQLFSSCKNLSRIATLPEDGRRRGRSNQESAQKTAFAVKYTSA